MINMFLWLSQVKEQVESLATYLKDLGILEGDRVLILSETGLSANN